MKQLLSATVFWCAAVAVIALGSVANGMQPYVTDLQGNFLLKQTVIAGVLIWCACFQITRSKL